MHDRLSGSRKLTPAIRSVMSAARVPVLVKNGDGFYLFANRSAEVLLGYDPGEIGGKHVSDLVDNDPQWLEAEFERFKAQLVWNASLTFKCRSGDLIRAALNAFATSSGRGEAIYTVLLHPISNQAAASAPTSVREPRYDLTSAELRLIQLVAAGFTDKDLATILGLSDWAVSREVALVLQKMRVTSRTEACVRALKARLIL